MFFIFFFQAEDGIRDWSVTGVQTCALPISRRNKVEATRTQRQKSRRKTKKRIGRIRPRHLRTANRSEERRVGKECRSRGSTYHEKEKEEQRIEENKRKEEAT